MMPVTLGRIFQAGFRNFLRNAWLSTAATAVMVVTLTIMSVSFVASMALNSTIHGVVNKIDISIYLKDSTTVGQAQSLQRQISQLANIASVKFISKDDALATFRSQHANDPTLLSGVSEIGNPLPASFDVKPIDPNNLSPISNFVKRTDVKPLLDATNPISYQGTRKKTVDQIIHVSNFIKRVGLIASVLFVIISILIIFNTIRMAIFSRREEIEIMRLMGATNWFIRGPFLFEAAFYGVIASFVATGLTYTLVTISGPRVASYIDFSSTLSFFRNNILLIILAEIVIGVLIGAISSLLAMIRYLKL